MNKPFNREIVAYAIFGVLTTLVNFAVYYVFSRVFQFDANSSNLVSIGIAIIFAFATNNRYVFTANRVNGLVCLVKRFFSFIGVRFLSMILDIGIFYMFTTIMSVSDVISKIVVAVVVIVFNYFTSKRIVFVS